MKLEDEIKALVSIYTGSLSLGASLFLQQKNKTLLMKTIDTSIQQITLLSEDFTWLALLLNWNQNFYFLDF